MENTNITVDALAIYAHPDDVELAVAGTLAKLQSLGYKTAIADVTRGEMGTRGTVEQRLQEAQDAAKILGVDIRENLGLPDGHVWLNEESRTIFVRLIRRLKPKVIFTHQFDDPHPDHNHITQIVRESARLATMKNYDRDFGQEQIEMPAVAYNVFSRLVAPSFIVDISGFLEKKMESIRAHKSQFYAEGSTETETRLSAKGFLDEIEARHKYYGSIIGAAAGEPFYVREALNVDDPMPLLTRSTTLYS